MFDYRVEELGLVALDSEFVVLEGKVQDCQMKDAKTCFIEMLQEKLGQHVFRSKLVT